MSIFNKIKIRKPKRNLFNLSHDKKMTLEMGQLVPIMCQEVIPSDSFTINTAQVMRMAPMLAPIMHKIDVYTHFFFVPNRILWENSEDFFTGGEDGNANPVYPYVRLATNSGNTSYKGTLVDYLGMSDMKWEPGQSEKSARVSALPFAAYGKIWNEYYRDQNLQEKLDVNLTDANNTNKMLAAGLLGKCFNRSWKHDYFTSALPFPQKGPDVLLPIGDEAPLVDELGVPVNWATGDVTIKEGDLSATPQRIRDSEGNLLSGNVDILRKDDNSDFAGQQLSSEQMEKRWLDPNESMETHTWLGGIKADLSSATARTINDLRTAFRLQEWLELNARAGGRYSEFLKAHFGVKSSDARLQRPEYLGGSKSPIVISEVLQQSETNHEDPNATPLGQMAGHGLNVNGSNSFNYYSEEHGWIIGIMSVVPRADYYQGIPKQFTKFDRFDHYYPKFAHLGEQAVKNKELFISDNGNENEETFGYLPRYTEYRYINNSIHGEFRDSLEFWHLGRKFEDIPMLNSQFIMCEPDKRIFAVTDEAWEQLYCHININVKAKRPLPYYGTPMM